MNHKNIIPRCRVAIRRIAKERHFRRRFLKVFILWAALLLFAADLSYILVAEHLLEDIHHVGEMFSLVASRWAGFLGLAAILFDKYWR